VSNTDLHVHLFIVASPSGMLNSIHGFTNTLAYSVLCTDYRNESKYAGRALSVHGATMY